MPTVSEHAANIVALAADADELVAAFRQLVADLNAEEHALFLQSIKHGPGVSDTIAGRCRLAHVALSLASVPAGDPLPNLRRRRGRNSCDGGQVATRITSVDIAAGFAKGMAELQTGGVTDADLNAARRFVADLERTSPGVVASLEAHGAGNDPRMVRAAIKEARWRGY